MRDYESQLRLLEIAQPECDALQLLKDCDKEFPRGSDEWTRCVEEPNAMLEEWREEYEEEVRELRRTTLSDHCYSEGFLLEIVVEPESPSAPRR